MPQKAKTQLRLVVQGRHPHIQPAGVRAVPPYLPHDVLALPGESAAQLAHRARQMATGSGVVVAWLFYPPAGAPEGVPLPPSRVLPQGGRHE